MELLANKKPGSSVRYVLSVGALVATCAVFAQDATSADPAEPATIKTLQTVVVTGSRIRNVDVETAQPIIVMDRTEIELQGFNSVADILQNLPEAGSPAINRSSVPASGEYEYANVSVPGTSRA